jgi:cytochrome d ubiquinol oxidase subunit II
MSLLTTSLLLFLGLSLLFYVLFAGADFGAGILEIFLGTRQREQQRALITHAMAPVWEANHVWLVLIVVILFMGFPKVYTLLSIYLHLPVMALLIGIVFRGCAFTFRHYDALDRTYYRTYSRAFAFSSVWSAFFLGVTGGGLILGKIAPHATNFPDLYLAPWANGFCVSLGLFTIALFAFLAAVYLVGEAKGQDLQKVFRQKAAWANVLLIVAGAAVFHFAEADGLPLRREFFENALSRLCFILAGLLWLPFWSSLKKAGITAKLIVRMIGVTIVTLVLVGWYAIQFPVAIRFSGAAALTFQAAAAPEATQRALLGALIVGSFLIFPSLLYLLKIFKWESVEKS